MLLDADSAAQDLAAKFIYAALNSGMHVMSVSVEGERFRLQNLERCTWVSLDGNGPNKECISEGLMNLMLAGSENTQIERF